MANAIVTAYDNSHVRYRNRLRSDFSREGIEDGIAGGTTMATHAIFLASGAFDSMTNSRFSLESLNGYALLAHMTTTGYCATRMGETCEDSDLKAAGGAFLAAPTTALGTYGAGYGAVEVVKAAAAPICNTFSAIMEMIPL